MIFAWLLAASVVITEWVSIRCKTLKSFNSKLLPFFAHIAEMLLNIFHDLRAGFFQRFLANTCKWTFWLLVFWNFLLEFSKNPWVFRKKNASFSMKMWVFLKKNAGFSHLFRLNFPISWVFAKNSVSPLKWVRKNSENAQLSANFYVIYYIKVWSPKKVR